MTTYVALLRAVNVGGTGKFAHAGTEAALRATGFAKVRTYIASGNVLFETVKRERAIKTALESALREYAGKQVGVLVRTATEMQRVLAANPFSKLEPNRTVAYFLDDPPPKDTPRSATGAIDEQVRGASRSLRLAFLRQQGEQVGDADVLTELR